MFRWWSLDGMPSLERTPRIIAMSGADIRPSDLALFHRHLLAFLVRAEDHHVVILVTSFHRPPWKPHVKEARWAWRRETRAGYEVGATEAPPAW